MILFTVWWWFIRKTGLPSVTKCQATQPDLTCLSNNVLAAIEKTYDSTMPTPLSTLSLWSFGAVTQLAPWCIPSYYAVCFVDKEGNYGPLSSWTPPIVASPSVIPGGCSANVPFLQIENTLDPNLKKYYVNVHRQDQHLNTASEGNIVGMLDDFYKFVDDPKTNPNINYTQKCKEC